MTSFPILDLIAGMIFIFFLMALVNNSCIELFAALFKFRAYMLRRWLVGTLGPACANNIMNHPLLNGLSKTNKSTHYMDGKGFAKSLVEEILKTKEPGKAIPSLTSANIDAAIQDANLPGEIKSFLRNSIAKTNAQKVLTSTLNEVEHFEAQIEQWFDSVMTRLTGYYKRQTVGFTFAFALLTVVALNVDSLQLATYLYNNPAARTSLASASYAAAQDSSYIKKVGEIQKRTETVAKENRAEADTIKTSLNELVTEMKVQKAFMDATVATLNSYLPIGWPDREYALYVKKGNGNFFILKKAGGLLITILAICLGAPFWFDVLGKVANLRSSVKPKEEKS